MEGYQKSCGVILSLLVLVCGIISSLSLVLLASNIKTCYPDTFSMTAAVTYLLISLGVLEAVNFVKSAFICCQRYDERWPTGKVLVWLLMSSCVSTTGVCTLLFYILPRTDLIRGLALLMSFTLLPMGLKIFIFHNFKSDKSHCKPLFVVSLAMQLLALCFTILHNYTTPSDAIGSTRTTQLYQRQPMVWSLPSTGSIAIVMTMLLLPFQWLTLYIEGDVTVFKKSFALVSLRQQLFRCRHKFGLIAPFWKAIWICLCLFLYIPSYIDMSSACSQEAPVQDKSVPQIGRIKDSLERLLQNDEDLSNKKSPPDPAWKLEWQYFCDKERDPSWIPSQEIEEVTMTKTDVIMGMVEKFIACSDPESKRCGEIRAKIDAIILPGRYTKQTIKEYLALVSYVEGEIPVQVSKTEGAVGYLAYRALAVTFVCCSVIAMISAMAIGQWKASGLSFVIAVSLIIPISLLLAALSCSHPSAALTPLLKCAEPWSLSSLIIVILCVIWSGSQFLFLLHNSSLELSGDLSMPLISSALTLALSSIKEETKPTQTFRSYKFSYIRTSISTKPNDNTDINQDSS